MWCSSRLSSAMSSVSGTVARVDGVEVLLLDRGVHRERFDDLVDDPSLLDEGPITGLLELLEQALDGLVVIFEEGDCVHGR